MKDALSLLFAGLAGYGGFACLALAMPEHWERCSGHPDHHAPRRRGLRMSGALMLCMAALACIWRDGASFGILLWATLMSAGGIAVALTLAWWPMLFRRLVRHAP